MRAARQASTSGCCYFFEYYERSRSLDYVIRPEIHHHSNSFLDNYVGDGGTVGQRQSATRGGTWLPATWYRAEAGARCGFNNNGRDSRRADSAQSQPWL